MDRRTSLAIFLLVTIYFVWMTVRRPDVPLDADGNPIVADGEGSSDPATPVPSPTPGVPLTEVPLTAPVTKAAEVAFEGCGSAGTWSTATGYHDVTLPEHEGPLHVQPLYMWAYGLVTGGNEGPWKPWGDPPGPEQLLSKEAQVLTVGAGPWAAGPATLAVESQSRDTLVLAGRAGSIGIRHAIKAVTTDGICVLEVNTTWTNGGSAVFTEPLWVGAHDRIAPAAGGMMARYDSHVAPLLFIDGDLAYGDTDGGKVGGCAGIGGKEPSAPGVPVGIEGNVEWFGVADRYFGFLILSETEGALGHFSTRGVGESALAGSHVSFAPNLQPGASHSASFRAYVGPLHAKTLDAVDPSLGNAIDLGFFAFFGYPLLWLLRFYQSLVFNWGVAIILLTLTVKLAFFPMTNASFKSMQRMQQIQPEMNRIKEEYADNPQEMQRLTMELMAREKVNPLAGCLPMVAQMPVWFALYQVLLSSVDLYHTDFLYLRDLSAPDPYCVLPVIVVVLMMVQQSFTNTSNMDPAQARVMKFMPLMFGVFFFTFPSGLALYMFVNMLLSILQQWWIKRSLGEAPAMAVM
jgi:YidC/Oxa1 family membrane protein insertase